MYINGTLNTGMSGRLPPPDHAHGSFDHGSAQALSYRRNGMSIFVLRLYSGYVSGNVTARFRSSTIPQK